MKFGLTMARLLSVLLLAIFCFGCGFSGVDNETVIRTVVEQQFYYKNSTAEKLAGVMVLRSDGGTARYPPYFAGRARVFSSKKLLYSNIKSDLIYLTTYGYLDYDNLKMISSKMADLQEKTRYNLTKIENTKDYYRQKDYEAYLLTITHPDITVLCNRIMAGIFNDLTTMYNVNWNNARQQGNVPPEDYQNLSWNLHALSQVTQDPTEMKTYGTAILKNFVNALDNPNLPFTTKQLTVYMKDTGDEIQGLEIYTMPNDEGFDFVYMSRMLWRNLNYQEKSDYYKWGRNSIDEGSLFVFGRDDLNSSINYPLNDNFKNKMKNNAELNKKFGLMVTKHQEALQKLEDISDLQSLEKFLDAKEQIDEELLPAIYAAVQSAPPAQENQRASSAPPTTPTPATPPAQSSPAQSTHPQKVIDPESLNMLNNTEVGIAFGNYYRAINEKRFSDAYSCLTEACRSRQGTLEEFAANRKDTLSVEILHFEQAAASDKAVVASYEIRTRDKVVDGVKVQLFAGIVNLTKTDNKWFIDNLASRLLETHLE